MFSSKKLLAIGYWLLASLAFATAPSTSIGTETVSGNTVTVNATAHGLAVNQGFCIAGSSVTADNQCGVVVSSSANSFTFTSASGATCSSSCGTVTAAKQIIVLEVSPPPNQQARILCWTTTQTPVAHAGQASSWTGASTSENAAISAGLFIEQQHFILTPNGTTAANCKLTAQNVCATDQVLLNSGITPGVLFGDWFDGTGWVN